MLSPYRFSFEDLASLNQSQMRIESKVSNYSFKSILAHHFFPLYAHPLLQPSALVNKFQKCCLASLLV